MTPSVGLLDTLTAQPARGGPVLLAPTATDSVARQLQASEPSLARPMMSRDLGDASAAEAVAEAFLAQPRLRATEASLASSAVALAAAPPDFAPPRPMSRPDDPARSPLAGRAFAAFALGGTPGVPDAQPLGRPGAFGVPPIFKSPPLTGAQEFIMPIPRGRVTSMFHQGRYHPAIDLAAPLGTPVRATTRKQKVTFAGRRGGYGNLVITRDPSGRQHYYGHLHRIIAGIGTLLEQGDLLGLLGSTGHSTGPHVHYEVRKSAGGHFNPATFLFPGLSVQRGYAWNDTRSPTVAAVRSTTKAAARTNVKRTVHAARKVKRSVHAARKVKRRVRVAKVARRARFAARAPTVRYYRTRRAARYNTRLAGRYAQPRPR